MRTLIIVSHPTIETSLNQQFFKEATENLTVTWHHLEKHYPDWTIDRDIELELLKTHDRIIFQFPEKEYQAGGKEEYTISELLRPYQRIAHKFEMTFLPPFVMAQFMYQTEEKRWERLVAYQQYLTLVGKPTLIQRINWFIERLSSNHSLQQLDQTKQAFLIDYLENEKEEIEDLTFILQELKEQ